MCPEKCSPPQLIAVMSWFIVNDLFFEKLKLDESVADWREGATSAVCGRWGLFVIFSRMSHKSRQDWGKVFLNSGFEAMVYEFSGAGQHS